MMNRRLLVALFLCNLIVWTAGNGLFPLLPVYARQLGASTELTGYYLSVSYLALAAGSLVAGWISNRLQRRKIPLIIAAAINAPMTWLMGQATNPWQLTVLTVVVWFLGGLVLTLPAILAGLFAGPHERGRVFGILALTSALGSLIGGLAVGTIADRWGYGVLFAVLAAWNALTPLIALSLKDRPAAAAGRPAEQAARLRFGSGFYLIVLANLLGSIAWFIGRLGTSVVMDELSFLAAAITSTMAVGGLIALPLTPLAGWLSDRFNRKLLLGLCYLAGTCGLAVLTASSALWHFWLASALISIPSFVAGGITPALVADLVPGDALDRALAMLSSSSWVGGIAGLAVSGIAIQGFGAVATIADGAAISILAVTALTPVRPAVGAAKG